MSGRPRLEPSRSIVKAEPHGMTHSAAGPVEILEAMKQAGWIVSSAGRHDGITYKYESAPPRFVCDVGARCPCTVAVDFGHCVGLPRLPNERLYLLP